VHHSALKRYAQFLTFNFIKMKKENISSEKESLVNEKITWESLINFFDELSVDFKKRYKKALKKGNKKRAILYKSILKYSKRSLKNSQKMLCETKHRLAEIETELS